MDRLIPALYESVLEPGRWEVFLESYAECVGASRGAVVVVNDTATAWGRTLVSVRVDPHYLERYDEYYGSINVYIQRARHILRPGVPSTGQTLCPDDELERTEYYNDYLSPQQIYHSLGVCVGTEQITHLGALPKNLGAFGTREIAVAELLAPHLESVMRLRRRLFHAEQRAAARFS